MFVHVFVLFLSVKFCLCQPRQSQTAQPCLLGEVGRPNGYFLTRTCRINVTAAVARSSKLQIDLIRCDPPPPAPTSQDLHYAEFMVPTWGVCRGFIILCKAYRFLSKRIYRRKSKVRGISPWFGSSSCAAEWLNRVPAQDSGLRQQNS